MGYTIREVSEILKIPVSTIRYYENLGLLPVIQRIEGKRVFTNENITDLKRIKKLKDMGMTLKDINNFNQLYSKGKLSFEQKIMILDQQHTVIIEQIEELQHTLEIIETERLKYSNIINKNHTAIICS